MSEVLLDQILDPLRIFLIIAFVVTLPRTSALAGQVIPLVVGVVFVAVLIPIVVPVGPPGAHAGALADGLARGLSRGAVAREAIALGLFSNGFILLVVLAIWRALLNLKH